MNEVEETFEIEVPEDYTSRLLKVLIEQVGFKKVEPTNTDNLKSNRVIQWEGLLREK